jgi:tetratricopeptide (TPR) repeat protein
MTTASGEAGGRRELQSKAAAAEAAGDLAAAERWLHAAIDLDARDADGWMQLAKFQTRTGNVEGGLQSLGRAAELAQDVKKFVQLGQLEQRRKNWPAADAALARAEALAPNRPNLPAMRGSLATEQGLYRAAVEHYARAVACAPRDLNLLQALCYALAFVDNDAAVAHVERFLATPDLGIADRVMALRLLVTWKERQLRAVQGEHHGPMPKTLGFELATDELATWLHMAQEWLRQEPDSYNAMQMVAQALVSSRTAMEAEPIFAKLRCLGKNDVAAVTYLDFGFHEALDDISLLAMQTALPPVVAVGGTAGEWDRAVLSACDLHYAETYASPLIGSFVQQGKPGTLFHLHLFDATDEEAAAFLHRVAMPGPSQFTMSREWTGLRAAGSRAPASQAARGYYHAIRYVRFREFLDRHPATPGLIVDADMIFNRPPEGFFDFLGPHDIVCPVGTGRLEIHNQLTACAVGFGTTARARKYLHRVAAYLFLCWQQGRLPWGVDQTALYAVYMAMAAGGAVLDLVDLPARIFDVGFSDESVLWAGKCSPEHREYEKYLAAISRFQLPT